LERRSHEFEFTCQHLFRKGGQAARKALKAVRSNELVFAVVGHAGSGTSEVAIKLAELLRQMGVDPPILKARHVISEWARSKGRTPPVDAGPREGKLLKDVEDFQDLGDEMRAQEIDGEADHTAVAKGLVRAIRQTRAKAHKREYNSTVLIEPDGQPRTYILDSLRHPAEVELLRAVYGPAFTLIGVVCEERRRLSRLMEKHPTAKESEVQEFMDRDANAKEKYGQHVADAFHLSDFFLDNSENRTDENGNSNRDWDINDKLSRLVKLVRRSSLLRPTVEETAMYHAYAAKMKSACLSRQVGAAVIDFRSNLIATGTNEAPKGGGGLYVDGDAPDFRCAYHKEGQYCRNTREQTEIIAELFKIEELTNLDPKRKAEIERIWRKSRIGGLLEFSRAVHAEMDAIVSAARTGNSLVGARLFVTTYPCHYCARHIVAAGIDEVQFIEPYPKSRTLLLHSDSVTLERSRWLAPSKMVDDKDDKTVQNTSTKIKRVLFRPFTGIAPRRYEDAFLKLSELKDQQGNMVISDHEWLQPWDILHQSYVQAELKLEETP